jgi:hypothetical protein
MRTRIALVAIVPFAVITISTLSQAAAGPPARVNTTQTSRTEPFPVVLPADRLAAYRELASGPPTAPLAPSGNLLDVNAALLADHPTAPAAGPAPLTPTMMSKPKRAAPVPAPMTIAVAALGATDPADTVTPGERAAWERVALCEEDGNWASDGPAFSGGLGISRANWSAFGGGEFAPEGSLATEDQQIMVAERIEPEPPDQDGCRGW